MQSEEKEGLHLNPDALPTFYGWAEESGLQRGPKDLKGRSKTSGVRECVFQDGES